MQTYAPPDCYVSEFEVLYSMYGQLWALANEVVTAQAMVKILTGMMTSSNGNIFRLLTLRAGNSPVTGESHTKASDAEL